MKKDINILHLEDAPADVVMVNHELRRSGLTFRTRRVDTHDGFMAALKEDPPDIILSDHGLPAFDGIAALAVAQTRCPDVPFIFVSDSAGEEIAIKTLTSGATDYVLKKNLSRLASVIRRALHGAELRHELAEKERQLRRREEQFRRLVEACPEALFVIHPTGAIVFANAASVRLLRTGSAAALVGQNLAELLPSGRWERVLELASQSREQTEPGCTFAEQLVRADGKWVDVEVSVTEVEFEDRPAIQFVAHDVTEQRRAEQGLRKIRTRDGAILQTAPDAIIFIDHRGVVLEWNPAAERILGYSRAQAVGRELTELIGSRAPQNPNGNPLQHCFASGESCILGRWIELPVRHSNGSEFPVELVVVQVEGGTPPLYTIHLRSIAQRRQADQEMRRLNAALERRVTQRTARMEEIRRELEMLSCSISHDFRAPLRHIACFAEILHSEGGWRLDPTSRRQLNTIISSAQHAQTQLDGLLSFSRLSRTDMRFALVDIARLVDSVRRQFQQECDRRKIDWSIGDMPEVRGDADMLRQAILQLLANAVKYTRLNENARIEIEGCVTEHETVISVRDNGVGFDMEHAPKLFGVFQRLHLSAQFEGIGIGLAIVRRIIQRHGGRTWAEGKPDAGATFYFSIPRLAAVG